LHYATGDYYIQDAGSLLAIALAEVQPNDVVCDLCAAPGGKASAMLELLHGNGLLVANEVIRSRVVVLKHNLARVGNLRYIVTNQDTSQFANQFEEQFDVVMVDAPCSGQSLTLKNKRGANAFDMKHIEHAAMRQQRILHDAISLLKIGGRLIYSTCTFADEENEDQIAAMLEAYGSSIERFASPTLERFVSLTDEACCRLWPHRHPTSGAFAARLRKVASTKDSNQVEPPRRSKPPLRKLSRKRFDDDIANIDSIELRNLTLFHEGLNLYGIDSRVQNVVQEWLDRNMIDVDDLPLIAIGTEDRKREVCRLPSYPLALATDYCIAKNIVELSDDQAKQYMNGAAIPVGESHEAANKVALATWQNQPIGWLKRASNRWNNLLPAVARIQMS
jgi:NOL1/NOP2/fmu family ribosome biogenesis protein/predicted O-methyltransferase YrrM